MNSNPEVVPVGVISGVGLLTSLSSNRGVRPLGQSMTANASVCRSATLHLFEFQTYVESDHRRLIALAPQLLVTQCPSLRK